MNREQKAVIDWCIASLTSEPEVWECGHYQCEHPNGTTVWIANSEQAKQVCREYCFDVGLCVTVEPVAYIYTGGEEAGVRVGLINYPRFPSTADELEAKATGLADLLMTRLCQHSYSIVGPETTIWVSRRPA